MKRTDLPISLHHTAPRWGGPGIWRARGIRTATLLLCLCATAPARAQNVVPWQQRFDDWSQSEDVESDAWEETYETLSELAREKIDINHCTREDLEALPFLSAQQVMDLMEYRDRAGRIESAVELRMVPSLSKNDADLLQQFLTFSPETHTDRLAPIDSVLRYGRHELTGALKVPFYDRRGDRNGYLGYKYKHWLRYTFQYRNQIKVGCVVSQDAGEPFFAGKNPWGYDYGSLYLQLSHVGRVRRAVVGRYRLRLGMGLAMNTSFGLGKLNTLASLGASSNIIVGHSSRSEANYLQGAAATLRLGGGMEITPFLSWRKIDATLNSSDGTVATILKSGYHRTTNEMARRRNTDETLGGLHLQWAAKGFHAGLTAFGVTFSRALRPDLSQVYRRWYPRGRHFWNASVDYGYMSGRLSVSGETATGNCGQVATINTVSWLVTPTLSLMALQRYYPYQYYSLFSMSYADGGHVNNESGVYVGGRWVPSRLLDVSWYVDAAYFAWPRYRASAPSHSTDCLLQASGTSQAWSYLLRLRLKRAEKDLAATQQLAWRTDTRWRAAIGYEQGGWSWRGQADMTISRQQTTTRGYMLNQQAGWKGARLQAYATAGYFHTDDYNSRVYAYERGLLYSFSFPMFAGEGLRYAALLRMDVSSWLTLVAKAGTTNYLHRTNDSPTGLDTVDRHSRTDLELQVRMKL